MSVGQAVFGTEVQVVDDQHLPVPAGAVGSIRYRGAAVADGFVGDRTHFSANGAKHCPAHREQSALLCVSLCEAVRGAAQNFYGFGADGISPYNYQFAFERRAVAHRSSAYAAYMWPAALGWLRDIRDLEEITSRDRHYLFYSLWKKSHKSPTSFSHNNDIYLDRAKPVLEGSWRFRMAEDFSNSKLRTTMQFKALGLAEEEKLEIQINGKQVPVDYITRVHDKNGQSLFEGDPLDPFHLYVIDMNWETTGRKQPLIFGDNQLTVRLAPSAAKAEGTVSIEELECYVYVRK